MQVKVQFGGTCFATRSAARAGDRIVNLEDLATQIKFAGVNRFAGQPRVSVMRGDQQATIVARFPGLYAGVGFLTP